MNPDPANQPPPTPPEPPTRALAYAVSATGVLTVTAILLALSRR
ncbi:hypothetical protein P3T37_002527 [Kitasatospora sp. MAA4]|nr:hypothetical protein [Kitasatospora sp. MAA4]MDH6133133.1 hypothetical protein [Kitasatospora sp. MAA4]